MRPRLADQFSTLEVQAHAARFGMWAFLASEVLLFAGLFALYAAYRVMYGAAFGEALAHNNLAIGTINTLILITSSLVVALSVAAIRRDRPRLATTFLVVAMALGLLFLALKAFEWSGHFREGIFPGRGYHYAELPGPGATMFFTLYFFMTGLHALHVIIGLGVLSFLCLRVARGAYSSLDYVPLECGALYWHLVDVVWIFLWPLFYLAR